jgi:hypothetical protein
VPCGVDPENAEVGGTRVEDGEACATTTTNSTDKRTVRVERINFLLMCFMMDFLIKNI